MNNTPLRVILFRIIGIVIFGAIIWFSYTRFSGYLKGPVITEHSLSGQHEIAAHSVILEGKGERIHEMRVNGREIVLTQDGAFREIVVLLPGDNIIEVDIYDQFGKHRALSHRIYNTLADDGTWIYEPIDDEKEGEEENEEEEEDIIINE